MTGSGRDVTAVGMGDRPHRGPAEPAAAPGGGAVGSHRNRVSSKDHPEAPWVVADGQGGLLLTAQIAAGLHTLGITCPRLVA
ncbi:hypothetical protein [Allokutzneria albata]|uniref:hypothetical protein n=1 Tax=Allokutzneria albata TaxID=211114 RepID=UPI0004C472F9|nr:hypothetical protein [Allokutzneria albata]